MMPAIDLEDIRRKLGVLAWDFTLTLNGETHRLRMPTPDILESVRRLAVGEGDVFELAGRVLEPPAAGLDLDQALALLVTYVHSYQHWSRLIFAKLVKSDPGAAAVLAVLAPAAVPAATTPINTKAS